MPEAISPIERRVLGVLVEKALTAAAPEPLTLNAVVLGSNQKSNREPVMTLEEPEADSALEGLQRKGLVFRITGGRTERWRHNLYDAWKVSKAELALLAELLLRGPQTAAEARSRASRMEPLDQETAGAAIKGLAERGFVVWLMPEGRRGALLMHGFYPTDEAERLKVHHAGGSVGEDRVIPPTAAPSESGLGAVIADMNSLRAEVAALRAAVEALQAALGVPVTSTTVGRTGSDG